MEVKDDKKEEDSKDKKKESKDLSKHVTKRRIGYWDAKDVLVFAKNDTLRHNLIEMRDIGESNLPILGKIVEKCTESAKLNGFDTFAEERLDNYMVKKPATVEKFLERVLQKLQISARKELDILTKFKRNVTGNATDELGPYDVDYFLRKYDEEQDNDIDEVEISRYFPLEHVVNTTLDIYQDLLGLKFKKMDCMLWVENTTCHRVHDSDSDELLGQFYLDTVRRDNKGGGSGAYVSSVFNKYNMNGHSKKPIAYMMSNFDSDNLLYHSDVSTFFHEFGHIMHSILGKSNYTRLSGTAGERDFVELPSQMLENWTWDKKVLKRMSHHYKTGEQIPDELLE